MKGLNYNREARELKLRYESLSAEITLDYGRRQTDLSFDIDRTRNEIHYLSQSLRRHDTDPDEVKAKLDAVVERISELSQQKVRLDFDRKQANLALARRKAEELDALEAKYSDTEIDEQGKEVVVL